MLVAGSANSSNSRRLSEVAEKEGTRSYLIDDYTCITPEMLEGMQVVGITAGASVPERIVTGIIDFLKTQGATSVEGIGPQPKHRQFPLPDNI